MNRAAFYAELRKATSGVFGASMSQKQVDGCEALIAATDGLPITHRAYLLATAYHETARNMQPVRETLASTDQSAVNRLERAWKDGKLKWVKTPYWRFDATGKTWLGRGYVQLTHLDNYAKAAAMVGVDLLGNPNLAMQPTVAARILVEGCQIGLFTGMKLSDFLPGDYVGARRIVNGTDRAAAIAGYARALEAAFKAAGADTPPTTEKPVTGQNTGFIAAIMAFLAALFGGGKK